jgi:hypothetical protein
VARLALGARASWLKSGDSGTVRKIISCGHTGIGESQPFHIKTAIKPELKRCSVSIYRVCPTESLTWDDVCQLWDNGVFTAEDTRNIAPLYFEKAELTAVLEVIKKVENGCYTPETMNTDRGEVLHRSFEVLRI